MEVVRRASAINQPTNPRRIQPPFHHHPIRRHSTVGPTIKRSVQIALIPYTDRPQLVDCESHLCATQRVDGPTDDRDIPLQQQTPLLGTQVEPNPLVSAGWHHAAEQRQPRWHVFGKADDVHQTADKLRIRIRIVYRPENGRSGPVQRHQYMSRNHVPIRCPGDSLDRTLTDKKLLDASQRLDNDAHRGGSL